MFRVFLVKKELNMNFYNKKPVQLAGRVISITKNCYGLYFLFENPIESTTFKAESLYSVTITG